MADVAGDSSTPRVDRPGAQEAVDADVRPDGATAADLRRAGAEDDEPARTRGEALGRYVVLGRLGAGGMGVVYTAYDPELDRKVAVKLLRSGQHADGTSAARLLREAKAMARLTHPNVITVHDVGTLGAQVFVAMEFVAGPTLRAWQAPAPRGWRELLAVYVQAGRGLAAAHAVGLVHRDFKPDNVIVGDDGRVRVLDFGLARAGERRPAPADPADLPDPTALPGPADPREPTALRRPADPRESTDLHGPTQLRPAAPRGLSGPRAASLVVGDTDLAGHLTREGAIVGTPAYMPPEQRLGLDVDARGDQFSFCVSLWEALTGALPFVGATPTALLTAVRERRFPPVSGDSKVPRRVLRVLARGLAFAPAERHASMDALLAVLTPERGRTRGLVLVGALAAAFAGLVVDLSRETARPPACLGGAARVAEVWGDDTRARVRAAFLATDLPYAAPAWREVEAGLQRHLAAWQAMYADNCAATQLRGEQSPALMDRRMACLDERLQETRALVAVFAAPDPGVVERAALAVGGLTPLSGCADAAALAAPEAALPADPAQRAALVARRLELAELRALLHTGSYTAGEQRVRPLAEAARALGSRPLTAEVELLHGAILCREGRATDGAAALAEAVWTATAARHDAVVVEATLELVYCVGLRSARAAEATQWARHAEAAIDRLGRDREPNTLRLLGYRGLLLNDAGRFSEALAVERRAVAEAERLCGPGDLQFAVYLGYLGTTLEHLGRFDEALYQHRRSLQIAERVLGPDHPRVAIQCNNIANVLGNLGEFDAALRYQDRDLAISLRTLGVDHPDTALSYLNRGTLLTEAGRYAEGLPELERAAEFYARSAPGDHADRAALDNNIGTVLTELGRLDAAQQHFERARDALLRLYGPDHPDLAYSEEGLGRVLTLQGRLPAARPHLDRALALREATFGPDHVDVAASLFNIAAWWERQGRCDQALPLLHRGQHSLADKLPREHPYVVMLAVGVARCEPMSTHDRIAALEQALARLRPHGPPRDLAELGLDLAEELWSQGQVARARGLAEEAARRLADTGDGFAHDRARAARWLAEHPPG